jgi:hypothetical protein
MIFGYLPIFCIPLTLIITITPNYQTGFGTVPPPAATSQKSLKTLSSRYEVAQESNLALPAGVNLGGNSVACGKPDKPARHQPRDLSLKTTPEPNPLDSSCERAETPTWPYWPEEQTR